ncbi:calcium-binding protein [Shimia thalassica]|uniref:calcium-binding protein n=1 Tax=Shimia thalassica TaxID=1715693 RepID=UPI0024954553|nr:calcium-binding protein [Shimia thalassica]
MTSYYDAQSAPHLVNTFSDRTQIGSAITPLNDGGYVIVWASHEEAGGSQTDVKGQIFADDGSPVGEELLLNQETEGTQTQPAVYARPDGGFQVLYRANGADSSGSGILGRGFDATGTPVSDEFLINAGAEDGTQFDPEFVILSHDFGNRVFEEMVAVWLSLPTGPDAATGLAATNIGLEAGSHSYVRDLDGGSRPDQPHGVEDPQRSRPDIALLNDGRAVAVWHITDVHDLGSVLPGIVGMISDSTGLFLSRREFTVATRPEGYPIADPSVAALSDGGFVVAYHTDPFDNGNFRINWVTYDEDGDRDRSGVVRRDGGVPNDEGIVIFPIGTTFAPEFNSQVVGLPGGGFLLLWWSPAHEDSPNGIYAQEFNAEGDAQHGIVELVADTPINGDIEVAALDDGDLVLTWTSNAAGTDGYDIMSQRISRLGDLRGDDEDNVLVGGSLFDRIEGGAGDDTLTGGNGGDTLIGGAGNDVIIGDGDTRDKRDVVYAGDGDDSVSGGWGNDELRGDAGNDTLEGGFGSDTVIGGAGHDHVNGSAWSDMLFGGGGDDFVNGGFGHDSLNGGAGADTFFHLGTADHGSDWIQDFDDAEGDILVFGDVSATADDFQVNYAHRDFSGSDFVDEAFIIYRPTGQIIWALVDGGAQASIQLQIAGQRANIVDSVPTDGPASMPAESPADMSDTDFLF